MMLAGVLRLLSPIAGLLAVPIAPMVHPAGPIGHALPILVYLFSFTSSISSYLTPLLLFHPCLLSGRKRRRDDSPPMSRDRYIPNYERKPVRGDRDRIDYSLPPLPDHCQSLMSGQRASSYAGLRVTSTATQSLLPRLIFVTRRATLLIPCLSHNTFFRSPALEVISQSLLTGLSLILPFSNFLLQLQIGSTTMGDTVQVQICLMTLIVAGMGAATGTIDSPIHPSVAYPVTDVAPLRTRSLRHFYHVLTPISCQILTQRLLSLYPAVRKCQPPQSFPISSLSGILQTLCEPPLHT